MSYAQVFQSLLTQQRASGVVLSGGKVYFYSPGTSDLATVYTSRTMATPAANPATLSTDGTVAAYGNGTYDIKITTSAGVQKFYFYGVSAVDALSSSDGRLSGIYDAASYASFQAAVAAIGNTKATLRYGTDVSLTADITTPITLELQPYNGAIISVASGKTLTINGSFTAGSAQAFSGSGSVAGLKEVMAEWFGAVGDGTTDDTTAIQKMLSSSTNYTTSKNKTFLVKQQLHLQSNCRLDGFTFLFDPEATGIIYGIYATGKDNITIENCTINCTDHVARLVAILNGDNIKIVNNSIHNPSVYSTYVTSCVFVSGCTDVDINNNKILVDTPSPTVGHAGIQVNDISGLRIKDNIVSKCRAKFGDGIYTFIISDAEISGNTVSDVNRICIVIEGDAITLSSKVVIKNNILSNSHDPVAPEVGGGVWIEGGKSDSSVYVFDNVITGCDKRGINLANGAVATGNTVIGTGLTGTYAINAANTCKIKDNDVSGCYYGIETNAAAGSNVIVDNNYIHDNTRGGVLIYRSHGTISITNNIIKDNGTGENDVYPVYGFGVKVDRHYNDQFLTIRDNTFISSMNETGADSAAGQRYALASVAGGDYTYAAVNVNQNKFVFSGTVSAYPANLAVAPCSFAYDSTSAITPREITYNNENTKITISNRALQTQPFGGSDGYMRVVGSGGAAPSTGTWKKGDVIENSDVSSVASVYCWVCTAGGSPGTWKEVSLA